MEFHNYIEDVVREALENMLTEKSGVCSCERCKLDMMALALNNLPSHYVVTQKGRIYTKLKEIDIQFKTDVVREVLHAIERIKANPRHRDNT